MCSRVKYVYSPARIKPELRNRQRMIVTLYNCDIQDWMDSGSARPGPYGRKETPCPELRTQVQTSETRLVHCCSVYGYGVSPVQLKCRYSREYGVRSTDTRAEIR